MPIERKPLFRPDVMHQHLVAFQLPEYIVTICPSLMHRADLIASGRADKLNEKELLPDFLTDFFVDLLGYTRPADGGQRYTLSREKQVPEIHRRLRHFNHSPEEPLDLDPDAGQVGNHDD